MSSSESFRAVRWVRTLNLVLQALLFLTFFGGLNYLASNRPEWRFDLTRQRKFSLAPETLSYLKNLSRPVHLVVTTSDDNPEIRGLIAEFVHATAERPAGKITVEYLDVYQNRRRADELGIEQSDAIVLVSGENRTTKPISDLYRYEKKERVAFQGEQELTAAILDVAEPGRKKIYFIVGHGELRPEDPDPARGLSLLREQLRVRNFDIDAIDLTVARQIPADAALLVAAVSPSTQSSYTRAEQELLRRYLSAGAGRLVLLLPPGRSADRLGLADLLFDWGILLDDDLVLDTGAENMTEDGDLMVWAYDENHPITHSLVGSQLPLRFGQARTVRPDPGRSNASSLMVVPVAGTSTSAWGEVHYRNPPFQLDPNDIRPLKGIAPADRLGLIVASERVSVRDNLPLSVPGGRLVVFGTGDLVSNQRIGNNGNLGIFLNVVNWAVDRDRQLTVPARTIERFSLALSAGEFQRFRYALMALPGAMLLLGLLVYWTRRV
jgi:hypothetical protein